MDEDRRRVSDLQLGIIETTMESLVKQMDSLNRKVDDLIDKLDEKFVTQAEFRPVRALVYGATALMLTTVFGAILAMVVTKR